MENPIKMDDLGVPLFLDTPICSKKTPFSLWLWGSLLQASHAEILAVRVPMPSLCCCDRWHQGYELQLWWGTYGHKRWLGKLRVVWTRWWWWGPWHTSFPFNIYLSHPTGSTGWFLFRQELRHTSSRWWLRYNAAGPEILRTWIANSKES